MKLTLKQVRESMREAEFNPRVTSDLTFAMDVDNTDFFEQQAILLIREAGQARMAGQHGVYEAKMNKSVQMITLAKLHHQSEYAPAVAKKVKPLLHYHNSNRFSGTLCGQDGNSTENKRNITCEDCKESLTIGE